MEGKEGVWGTQKGREGMEGDGEREGMERGRGGQGQGREQGVQKGIKERERDGGGRR